MNILLVGDTHGMIAVINRYCRMLDQLGTPVDYVLQAGDFGYFEDTEWPEFVTGVFKFEKPTYVIHGNHEDPRYADLVMDKLIEIPNFYAFARGGEIVELRKDEEVVRIFGVGGAPCVDNPRIRYPFFRAEFDEAVYVWNKAGNPPIDILLTHEAPTGTGKIGDSYWGNPWGCGIPELRTLWETVRPKWQVNGHYHKKHVHQEDGLNHMILDVAEEAVVLLDTATWKFTDLTFSALTRMQIHVDQRNRVNRPATDSGSSS